LTTLTMRSVFLLAFAGFAALASAHSKSKKDVARNAKVVDVKVTAESGTVVKITVKNISKRKIDFFQRGTVLDDNPVHKLEVRSAFGGDSAPFIGVHPRVQLEGELHKDSFRMLKPGHTAEFKVDAATVYDMTAGGEFKVSAEGSLPWSTVGKRKIAGECEYKSNTVTIKANTKAAFESKKMYSIQKRNILAEDCAQNSGKAEATRNALAVCANLAFVAGEMAIKGDEEQFVRYFRTADPRVRSTVSQRFHAVANECAARSNKARTFCTDPRQFCRSDYIAYTLGTDITNCDLYWSFPLVNTACHGVGQATTTIHEMTHIDGLFDPSTDDFPGHYGWPALSTLPPEQAIMNGDNYGFYANSVYTGNLGC